MDSQLYSHHPHWQPRRGPPRTPVGCVHPLGYHTPQQLTLNSVGSALDGAHGNWEPVVSHLARSTPLTIAAKSQAFAQHVVPLGSANGTRLKAWRNCCTVLIWSAANHALDKILPMSTDVFHAMLWDFTSLGASNSTLKSIVDSVISKHHEAQLQTPVPGHRGYHRLMQCLTRILG